MRNKRHALLKMSTPYFMPLATAYPGSGRMFRRRRGRRPRFKPAHTRRCHEARSGNASSMVNRFFLTHLAATPLSCDD